MFQALKSLIDRWRVLGEMRAADRQAKDANEIAFGSMINLARDLYERGEHDRAMETWRKARHLSPQNALLSKGAMRLLLDLKAYDEADALIAEGRRKHPYYEHFAKAFIELADRKKDRSETLARCEIIRKRLPELADGYTVAATCLIELGRYDEAEALIEQAVRKMPADRDVLIGYARHAGRRRDWETSLRRWEVVKTSFDSVMARTGMVECLRELGRFDEAESIAAAAVEDFPTDPWSLVGHAMTAAARGDLDTAVDRWKVVCRRCPFFVLGYLRGAETAQRAGRDADAEAFLKEGVLRVGFDLGVWVDYARLAHVRRDWSAAAERWAIIRERFPECEEAVAKGAQAEAALAEQTATGESPERPAGAS